MEEAHEMSIVECFKIVLELAVDNSLDLALGQEPEFAEMYARQQEALERVGSFIERVDALIYARKKVEEQKKGTE